MFVEDGSPGVVPAFYVPVEAEPAGVGASYAEVYVVLGAVCSQLFGVDAGFVVGVGEFDYPFLAADVAVAPAFYFPVAAQPAGVPAACLYFQEFPSWWVEYLRPVVFVPS